MKAQVNSRTQFEGAAAPAPMPPLRKIQFSKGELEMMNGWMDIYNRHQRGAWILRDNTLLPDIDGIVIRDAGNTCRIEVFKLARAVPLFKIGSPVGEYESRNFSQLIVQLRHHLVELTPLVFGINNPKADRSPE